MRLIEIARKFSVSQITLYKMVERGTPIGLCFKKENGELHADLDEVAPRIEEWRTRIVRGEDAHKIGFRVSTEELKTIQRKAEKKTIAEYCREKALS